MIRIFGYEVSRPDAKYAAWRTFVFFLAFVVPMTGLQPLHNSPDAMGTGPSEVLREGALFALLLCAATFAFGLDSRAQCSRDNAFFLRLALAIFTGGILSILALRAFSDLSVSPGNFFAIMVLAFLGLIATRRFSDWFLGLGGQVQRVIVVGAGERALSVKNLMTNVRPARYQLVGFIGIDSESFAPEIQKKAILSNDRPLADLAREYEVDEIIVALDDRRGTLPIDALLKAKLNGVRITDLIAFYERERSAIQLEQMHPSWIVFSSDFRLGPARHFVKRVFDFGVALFLVAITAPVMLLVAVASFVESRGREPVLYHQDRVGYGGKVFRLHKFRSMTVDAERDGLARWANVDDDRVTRVGRVLRKYRLDELPQLFNVLAGEMSLVGPRPERPEFIQELTACIPYYGERHCVKPGLAGWAQLMYPYGASVEDAMRKLEYDLYYIKHASVVWDLVILMRTVEVVLLARGSR